MFKVFIVSYFFPPSRGMGSLRMEKLVKYLPEVGFEPLVLTGGEYGEKQMGVFRPPFDLMSIFSTLRKKYIRSLFSNLKNLNGKDGKQVEIVNRRGMFRSDKMIDVYLYWVIPAVILGLDILKRYNPDIIFSSHTPPSSVIVASILQKYSGLPWVAEFRDLWANDPYETQTSAIDILDNLLESFFLKNSRALVATTNTAANILRSAYNKPTYVVYNGFDECDYPDKVKLTDQFTITYTGTIIPGIRKPDSLFKAVRMLSAENKISPQNFRIRFYGPEYNTIIYQIANKYQVQEFCDIQGPISYKESLNRQCESSILLLVELNDQRANVSIPGKLFEYLGANRPILCLGYDAGSIANILHETKQGVVLNDPEKIYTFLLDHYSKWGGDHSKEFKIERSSKIQQLNRYSMAKKLAGIFEKNLR